MILKDIQDKLKEVDDYVFYGAVDLTMKEQLWNYIVFNRVSLGYSANKTSYSDYFDVHIIREEFIPEGLDEEVISKMLEIPGMRLANNDGTFDYVTKNSTNTVVEMLTLRFVRARK